MAGWLAGWTGLAGLGGKFIVIFMFVKEIKILHEYEYHNEYISQPAQPSQPAPAHLATSTPRSIEVLKNGGKFLSVCVVCS